MELVSNINFAKNKLVEITEFISPLGRCMPEKWVLEFSKNRIPLGEQKNFDFPIKIDPFGAAYASPANIANVTATDYMLRVNGPFSWMPSSVHFPGNYIRGTPFTSSEEFLVYVAAHEVRHLQQWFNKKMRWLGRGFPGSDAETDADLYALLKLNEWRRRYKS